MKAVRCTVTEVEGSWRNPDGWMVSKTKEGLAQHQSNFTSDFHEVQKLEYGEVEECELTELGAEYMNTEVSAFWTSGEGWFK